MPPDCFPLPTAAPAGPARGLLLAAALLLAGCNATAPHAAASPAPKPAPARTAEPAGAAAAPAAEPAAAPAPEPARPPAAPAPQAGTAVDQVLAYSDRVLRLPPAELAREVARLGEAEDASPDTPLLLATALAQTRQPVDTARALGLVQRVLGSSTAPAQALHPLARLMEARLLQQRRLEDQLERQAQQLRDAQRRNDQLNERLEAVRAIERSLTTRPAALPASPPAPAGSGPQRPAP